MCRISEEIYNEGLEKGLEKGLEEGARNNTVQSIRNLMETLGLKPSQAFDALKVPESQRGEYLALL